MKKLICRVFLSITETLFRTLLMGFYASSSASAAFSSLKEGIEASAGVTESPTLLLSPPDIEDKSVSPSVKFVSPTYTMIRQMFLSCQMPWDDVNKRLEEDEVFRAWWDKQNETHPRPQFNSS